MYEGGLLRPPVVRPRFRAFQLGVLTSRRKNGEKGWKEKGRQEAVDSRPTGTGGAHKHPLFFCSLALLRELAPRRAVPLRAKPTCQAAEGPSGTRDERFRNLTHGRGEIPNGEKRRKEKGRQEALARSQEAVVRIASCHPLLLPPQVVDSLGATASRPTHEPAPSRRPARARPRRPFQRPRDQKRCSARRGAAAARAR